MADKTVRQIAHEAVGGDHDELQQAIRWQKSSEADAQIRAILEVSSQLDGLSVSQEAFDINTSLLNFTNGTLDLKFGDFQDARANDIIFGLMGSAWEPDAKAPHFTQFIEEIIDANEKDARYL